MAHRCGDAANSAALRAAPKSTLEPVDMLAGSVSLRLRSRDLLAFTCLFLLHSGRPILKMEMNRYVEIK